MKDVEILPGIGLGPLRFGMTREDIEATLGEAPESEFVNDDRDSYLLLEYQGDHLALFFDLDSDLSSPWQKSFRRFSPTDSKGLTVPKSLLRTFLPRAVRLSSMEVGHSSCLLFGERLFPRDHEQVLNLLQRNLLSKDLAEIKEEKIKFVGQSLWVPSLRGTFYFSEEDLLEEFQWSPFSSPDDEIIRPEAYWK